MEKSGKEESDKLTSKLKSYHDDLNKELKKAFEKKYPNDDSATYQSYSLNETPIPSSGHITYNRSKYDMDSEIEELLSDLKSVHFNQG